MPRARLKCARPPHFVYGCDVDNLPKYSLKIADKNKSIALHMHEKNKRKISPDLRTVFHTHLEDVLFI